MSVGLITAGTRGKTFAILHPTGVHLNCGQNAQSPGAGDSIGWKNRT